MLINEYNEKRTPKEIAKRVLRTSINIINIDDEIEDFDRLTKRERKLIHDQYWKLVGRIEKRYVKRKKD
jgi:hypothetical protein